MTIKSADILLTLCLVSTSVLAGLGVLETEQLMFVVGGIVGYATRAAVRT